MKNNTERPNNLPEVKKTTIVKKKWGIEEIIVNNEKYCAKVMTLVPNGRLSLQWHAEKQETFFVLEGKFLFESF